jgi:hypothetical protein
MATLHETLPRELDGAGPQPGRDLWLLPGSQLHDVHKEPVGNFAGRVYPDDPVGTFGNLRHPRREGTGTYRGDADRQREGSFADRVSVEHFPHAA